MKRSTSMFLLTLWMLVVGVAAVIMGHEDANYVFVMTSICFCAREILLEIEERDQS